MSRFLLAITLLLIPGLAHADWYEASTKHFVVYSDQNPKRLDAYATKLERFDKAMRILRGVVDPPISPASRVTTYVVHAAADIERLSTYGVRGFYKSKVSGPVAFVPKISDDNGKWDLDADSVLRHEYSHHFMFDNYADVALPVWFVEGFAEFHATAVAGNDGSITFGNPPAYRAAGLMDSNSLSLTQVLTADTRRLDLEQLNVLYGKGWLLMHYLTFEPSRRGQLSAYVRALNEGKSALEAAKVLGDLKKLDRDLGHYLLKPKFDAITIYPRALQVDPTIIRKLTPGEAATMQVRIRSEAGVDTKDAPVVFKLARSAAEPYPNDPGAQLALAEAAYDARDFIESLAAANRALAVDSAREKAFVYQGMAAMAVAVAASKSDPETWLTIRRSLLNANHIEPDDPQPLMLYYQSFIAAGQQPTTNAKAALMKAFEFAPEDANLRMLVVDGYLNDSEYKEARMALLPLAYSPHPSPLAKSATELLDAIDGGDKAVIEAKIAALRKEEAKQDK